ncbi:phosphoribosyl transferase [Candidatus Berkelbacteria bacterium CG10_big_fil_rev_8_21_14_0_10_41_12]|uniref:Phosphoribosyl transferase n=1 Tax=Candidatus Berkelbacteria bacterium CG10_big_fil_rev_8_21_14_0_10_41_12 TaxID=1974513 RepID=A0A2M6WX88_9BACT|nr:MAG: phosphoribosyl transferase [Candidatus Berkelbacteria bacterium CG10_big_fil_rev_8_21_14_0_10_41_12]
MFEEVPPFKDRADAGQQLAVKLEKYRGKDAVILALPRGGVAIGGEIASSLNLPLDIIPVRKIGHPFNPEYAIAALTSDGHIVLGTNELPDVDKEWLEEESKHQQLEAQRRREVYSRGRAPKKITGKIAIVVDDGLATGLTMQAAVWEIKQKNPKKIIVAVPVAPADTAEKISKDVDKVTTVLSPINFLGAIGAYYENFEQVSDEQVIKIIDENQNSRHAGRNQSQRP